MMPITIMPEFLQNYRSIDEKSTNKLSHLWFGFSVLLLMKLCALWIPVLQASIAIHWIASSSGTSMYLVVVLGSNKGLHCSAEQLDSNWIQIRTVTGLFHCSKSLQRYCSVRAVLWLRSRSVQLIFKLLYCSDPRRKWRNSSQQFSVCFCWSDSVKAKVRNFWSFCKLVT